MLQYLLMPAQLASLINTFYINSNIFKLIMSAQLTKQLKIKTSMLKRLRKQYESYQKESNTISAKIKKFEQQLALGQNAEELEIQIRKNKQFLGESQSVLSNVKQKFVEAFEGLVQFLSQKGEQEGVVNTQEKKVAQDLSLEVETFLENLE